MLWYKAYGASGAGDGARGAKCGSMGERMRVSTGNKWVGSDAVVTKDGRRDSSIMGDGPRDGGRDANREPDATAADDVAYGVRGALGVSQRASPIGDTARDTRPEPSGVEGCDGEKTGVCGDEECSRTSADAHGAGTRG